MSFFKIDPAISSLVRGFQFPATLGFGKVFAPIMIRGDYKNGSWGDLKIIPYGPIELSPTAKVLHYGQEIFEGLKAYRVDGEGPFLFRHRENAKRFNHSSRTMAMPEVPEEYFMKAVETITSLCRDLIPSHSGESLYLRPFCIATEEHLGVKPAEEFCFCVIASPSGSYFSGNKVSVMIERQKVRAFPGGTGSAKTGGNYAKSLTASIKASRLGFDQVLWLDALEHRYIEEMSGMNFFAVIDGCLYTPKLTDTILAGVTRDSIIQVAKNKGMKVFEERMDIDLFLTKIKNAEATEAFACGTAAIITPIGYLAEEQGERYVLPEESVSAMLRAELLGIQEGRLENFNGWRYLVENINFD